MCGLLGMIGPDINKDDRELFSDLLYTTALRGPHSTGLLTATPYNVKDFIRLKKAPVDAFRFIIADATNGRLLEDPWAGLFLGHCRFATVGEVNAENAHPFRIGSLVGAHNGTLNDWWSMGGTDDLHKTDSQIMFERMDKEGIAEVLKDVMPSSAYAISVYDTDTQNVILSRNKHRPLFVALNRDRGVLYWASEWTMLEFAASRNRINIDIFELEEQKMYVINPDEITKGNDTPWDVTDIPVKEMPSIFTVAKDGDTTTDQTDPWLVEETCSVCTRPLLVKEVLEAVPIEVLHRDGKTERLYCCSECTQKSMAEIESEQKRRAIPQSCKVVDLRGEEIILN